MCAGGALKSKFLQRWGLRTVGLAWSGDRAAGFVPLVFASSDGAVLLTWSTGLFPLRAWQGRGADSVVSLSVSVTSQKLCLCPLSIDSVRRGSRQWPA